MSGIPMPVAVYSQFERGTPLITNEVTPGGSASAILVPKRFIGREVDVALAVVCGSDWILVDGARCSSRAPITSRRVLRGTIAIESEDRGERVGLTIQRLTPHPLHGFNHSDVSDLVSAFRRLVDDREHLAAYAYVPEIVRAWFPFEELVELAESWPAARASFTGGVPDPDHPFPFALAIGKQSLVFRHVDGQLQLLDWWRTRG